MEEDRIITKKGGGRKAKTPFGQQPAMCVHETQEHIQIWNSTD